jgi:hypothetical protein
MSMAVALVSIPCRLQHSLSSERQMLPRFHLQGGTTRHSKMYQNKTDALRSAFSNSHKALQVQHTRFPAIRPSRQTLDFDMMFRHLAYCLLALSSSVLAANICGTIGIHNGTKISYYMGNFFYKGPTSFALCALYCKKDTGRCKSFRYAYYSDAAGQYCEFFDNGL